MISAGDFRNGVTLEIEGNVFQIVEFQHVKPGKGAAFVRTKLKNIINGGLVERSFRPTEKFPQARIDRKDMQYLYEDGGLFTFMDVETYDQIALNAETIGDALKFVKENEMCKVCFIGQWGSRLCVDAGENFLAEKMETAVKITVTGLSLPYIEKLFQIVTMIE